MDFIKRKDILYPFLICTVLLLIIGFNYYTFGNFFYDCGREFLVPEAINKGNVLIKDIFISYFPLSYQINAFLFKIFGSSLDVLRIAGVFCLYSISILIYFISREFLDENKSLIAAFVVVLISMFNVSYISNYVLSYSYAFIYGTLTFFLSIFFALKFIKNDKFLYFSFLFLGFSFALKAEFIFVLIPYFIMLIYKKCSFKNWLISVICFSLPILSSFLVLFIQGFNLVDLKEYFNFMDAFLNSKILKIYSHNAFLKNPIDWILYNLKHFVPFSIKFLIFFCVFWIAKKCNKKWISVISYTLLFVIFFVISVIQGNYSAGLELSFLALCYFYILYKTFKIDFSLFFLALVSIFISARFNFIYSGSYLTYTMPVALLTCLIYFAPKNKILINFMLCFSIVNIFYFSISQFLFTTNKIETIKGKMLIPDKNESYLINKTFDFIRNKTKKDDTILILPEGIMFNYLGQRKTNLKFYQLLPNHIEALGESNIVNSLGLNPPDYIFILNTDYSIYGTSKFCEDFGLKICDFTYRNYNFEEKIEKGENKIEIYKLK